MKFAPIILICLMVLTLKTTQAQTFVHPGVPFTRTDLEQLKLNIKKEPWKSAYEALSSNKCASLNYVMQGPFQSVSRSPHVNNRKWLDDMEAVHHLTIMWVFNGNDEYARKATNILDAWATTNTHWGGDEAILDIGDAVQFYATAADILKSSYSGWTAANTAHVNNYFANVLWPTLDIPNPVRGANQGADAIKAGMGIAAFLDDKIKFKQALASLRNDPSGGLANTLSNGQVGDSGRDEGHTAGQIWNLAWAAEVAWKQGVDVFADLDNRLHAAGELYSKYDIDTTGIKFIRFGNPYACYLDGFGWKGGARRKNPMYNIIHNAYAVRKGIPTPFTDKLSELTGENKDSFLFRKTSDNSRAKSQPPLVHPKTKAVRKLSAADIGKNTAAAGKTRFVNGTWSISGSGKIAIPAAETDAFHFAYKKLSGDAAIIARVISQDTVSGSGAGVMIRETLRPDAKFAGVFLKPGYGAKTTWRGASAFCKTDISWDIKTQTPRNYEEHKGIMAPYWLKLERINNRVSMYHSLDAENWTCIENVEIPFNKTVYIGLCVSSQDGKVLNTSSFAEVAITGG